MPAQPADPQYFQVLTTTATEGAAAALSQALLVRRVAACVQVVGPITSRYWWEGAIETATEWLCIAKTTATQLDQAMAVIGDIHDYDVPEITALPVARGSDAYLSWVSAEATGNAGPTGGA